MSSQIVSRDPVIARGHITNSSGTAEDKNNKLMSSEGMEATEAEIQQLVDDDEAMLDDGDASAGFSFD